MKTRLGKNYKKIATKKSMAPPQNIDQYVHFFDQLRHQISNPSSNKSIQLELERQVPGITNLFESFATGSQNFVFQEWNPFSQKIFISRPPPVFKELTKDFEEIVYGCARFVELAHEAMHILLWEPFFTGKHKPRSVKEFIDFSLCFEGFCFWYGDILITPLLRTYLPDGEFVFSRAHISQKYFHPYRAFSALGIDDKEEILESYLDGFRGYETALFDKKNSDLFVGELSNRIYGFYVGASRPSQKLYNQFKETGIFSKFYYKFCNIPGLPNLLSDDVVNILEKNSDPSAYCLNLYETGLKKLSKISKNQIYQVRSRRLLQTRAYSAICLEHVLEKDLFCSLNGRAFSKSKVLSSVREYLDKVEVLLHRLADGASGFEVIADCQAIDQFYEKAIRTPMRKSDIWISERGFYYPDEPLRKGKFGVIVGNNFDQKDLRNRVTYLFNKFYPHLFSQQSAVGKKKGEHSKIQMELYKFVIEEDWKNKGGIETLRNRYNKAVTSKGIIEQWSAPLYETNPQKNYFGEFLFVYE